MNSQYNPQVLKAVAMSIALVTAKGDDVVNLDSLATVSVARKLIRQFANGIFFGSDEVIAAFDPETNLRGYSLGEFAAINKLIAQENSNTRCDESLFFTVEDISIVTLQLLDSLLTALACDIRRQYLVKVSRDFPDLKTPETGSKPPLLTEIPYTLPPIAVKHINEIIAATSDTARESLGMQHYIRFTALCVLQDFGKGIETGVTSISETIIKYNRYSIAHDQK